MKSFLALTILMRIVLAAPVDSVDSGAMDRRQANPAEDLDAFLSSLSSLLGMTEATATDIYTFSTTVSGTPTEVYSVTTTTAAFEGLESSIFERRQAPGDLAAILSSLEAVLAATTTTAPIGCPTDIVDVSTTIAGTPTEVPVLLPTETSLGFPDSAADIPAGLGA